jgi:hypothetical protein
VPVGIIENSFLWKYFTALKRIRSTSTVLYCSILMHFSLGVCYSQSYMQHHIPQNLLTLKVHYKFRAIWPSSGVKIFLMRKLLSSLVNKYASHFDALVCVGVGVLCSSLLCVLLRVLFLKHLSKIWHLQNYRISLSFPKLATFSVLISSL